MVSSNFCQEIYALESIAMELSEQGGTNEEILVRVKSLISIKDKLNARLIEMEEYYMGRIDLYQEKNRIESSEMEKYADACSNKYLDLLVKTKELKNRIEELEVKNSFYKSRMSK